MMRERRNSWLSYALHCSGLLKRKIPERVFSQFLEIYSYECKGKYQITDTLVYYYLRLCCIKRYCWIFFFFFFQHYPSSVSFHWSSWLEFSGKFASCNAVRNTCSCASKFSHLCKSLFTSNSELCSLVFSSFVCVSNASHLMEYSLFFCSTRSCCILTSSSSVSSSETVLSSEEIKNK